MFPKDSAFGQQADAEAKYQHPMQVPPPIRHVGRPNIVEVPIDVLERWIQDLEAYMDGSPAVESVAREMSSYFRG